MAAPDDKAIGESTIISRASGAIQAAVKKLGYTNVRSIETFPYNDAVGGGTSGGPHFILHLHGRQAPGSDYPSAPIGSTFLELTASGGGAVTESVLWLKKAAGWKASTTGVAST